MLGIAWCRAQRAESLHAPAHAQHRAAAAYPAKFCANRPEKGVDLRLQLQVLAHEGLLEHLRMRLCLAPSALSAMKFT